MKQSGSTWFTPIPYHQQLSDHFEKNEPELWQWIVKAQSHEEIRENVQLSLLKTTVQLDRETYASLYQNGESILAKLHLDIPVTFYQETCGSLDLNAMLHYIPGEAHVVFSGPVIEKLNAAELAALIGHELSHYCLWEMAQQRYYLTAQLLRTNVDYRTNNACLLSDLRLFQLYTEIFADRGGYLAEENLHATIACLVKMHTGMATVNVEAYQQQAETIFNQEAQTTEQETHPEIVIRVKALELWVKQGDQANAAIQAMIEGEKTIKTLDTLSQYQVTQLTLDLISWLLQPDLFRTQALLAHLSLFERDYQINAAITQEQIQVEIKKTLPSFEAYWCYIMLDFVTADADLMAEMLCRCLEFCQALALTEPFKHMVSTEIKQYNRKTLDQFKITR